MAPETLPETLKKQSKKKTSKKGRFTNLSSIEREARLRCISKYAGFSSIPKVLLGFLRLPRIPEDSLGFLGFPRIRWDSRGFARTPGYLPGLAIHGILANS